MGHGVACWSTPPPVKSSTGFLSSNQNHTKSHPEFTYKHKPLLQILGHNGRSRKYAVFLFHALLLIFISQVDRLVEATRRGDVREEQWLAEAMAIQRDGELNDQVVERLRAAYAYQLAAHEFSERIARVLLRLGALLVVSLAVSLVLWDSKRRDLKKEAAAVELINRVIGP